MNTTQIGITAGSVFIVSAFSAILFSILNRPNKIINYRTSFRASTEYRPKYVADRTVDLNLVEDDMDFDRPGYNADRPGRDPTMPVYDPFKKTGYKGGTRCMNCRLRYTRRK